MSIQALVRFNKIIPKKCISNHRFAIRLPLIQTTFEVTVYLASLYKWNRKFQTH